MLEGPTPRPGSREAATLRSRRDATLDIQQVRFDRSAGDCQRLANARQRLSHGRRAYLACRRLDR